MRLKLWQCGNATNFLAMTRTRMRTLSRMACLSACGASLSIQSIKFWICCTKEELMDEVDILVEYFSVASKKPIGVFFCRR